VNHLNATDHEANGQADRPPDAAVRDADPPVDVSVATGHPPGHDQGHNHTAALIVTIGDQSPAHLARIVLPLDNSTKQTTNRPQEEPMPARSKTSPTKTRSGGSSPRRRENPKKTNSQDPNATTVAESKLDDVQWLATLGIRQKLADTTAFDREALLWRHTWPEVEWMIRWIEVRRPDLLKEVESEELNYSSYAYHLEEMITFPDPDSWHICSSCKGTGRGKGTKGTCDACDGTGYKYFTRDGD
jgi:hypothetical protein